jgi:hypothetical protein
MGQCGEIKQRLWKILQLYIKVNTLNMPNNFVSTKNSSTNTETPPV